MPKILFWLKGKNLELKNMDLKILTFKSCCLNALCLSSTCGLSLAATWCGSQQRVVVPNLKTMVSLKKMLKHVIFFNAKTNFFQKNRFFSSVLILLPTQGILNYSAFCMLIFCMNQCRCSLNAERSCCISVIICAMKIRYLKPNLRKKKCYFACLAFRISLNCDGFCTASHIFIQSVRTSTGTNSSSAMCNRIQSSFRFCPSPLFLSCLVKEELWNVFSLNVTVPKTCYVNVNNSVIQRKYK